MKSLNITTIFYFILISFFFLALQSAMVWLNEEFLLVLSFFMFYQLGYVQLKNSLEDFFLEKKFNIQNNIFVFLKSIALTDLKFQKEIQRFISINLLNFVISALNRQLAVLNASEMQIQKTFKNFYVQECISLLKAEKQYKNDVVKALTSDLINELFEVQSTQGFSYEKEFFFSQLKKAKSSVGIK